MDNRELFHATMHRENDGHLLHMEQGFNVPYAQWLAQGLPASVLDADNMVLTEAPNLYDYFNVTAISTANSNSSAYHHSRGR